MSNDTATQVALIPVGQVFMTNKTVIVKLSVLLDDLRMFIVRAETINLQSKQPGSGFQYVDPEACSNNTVLAPRLLGQHLAEQFPYSVQSDWHLLDEDTGRWAFVTAELAPEALMGAALAKA